MGMSNPKFEHFKALIESNQNEYQKARAAKAKAIIDDPAPVEKFNLIYPIYPASIVKVYNGAGKKIGDFPATTDMRRMFGGRAKITVKAKIIDGQFEVMKVL